MGEINIDSPVHMWSFWRDKFGVEEAVKGFFPGIMGWDHRISEALERIDEARKEIDRVMSEHAGEYL